MGTWSAKPQGSFHRIQAASRKGKGAGQQERDQAAGQMDSGEGPRSSECLTHSTAGGLPKSRLSRPQTATAEGWPG